MFKKYFFLLTVLLLVSCNSGLDQQKIEAEINKLEKISEETNSKFFEIRTLIEDLADSIQILYENQNQILPNIDKSKYKTASNGVFYKTKDDGGSAVYVSTIRPLTKSIKDIVYFTEPIENEMKKIMETKSEIAQIYYNDNHDYNRIYPFFDVLSVYEPNLDISSFNFYYLADETHNPSRKSLWVADPYVDPAGRGWMVSSIAPVYFKNQLVGVPGIDITINTLIEKYLMDDNILILDNKGVVVAAHENLIKLLSFPQLKDHKYIETIKLETFRKDLYNILKSKSKEIRNIGERIFSGSEKYFNINLNDKNYYFFISDVEEVNWKIVKVLAVK
ncbi:MAG: hypothetical protein JEY94_10900 [Melioribacteraceae bacterium]|nr:hypothetical protein [Melioribacteraceae bacterium]